MTKIIDRKIVLFLIAIGVILLFSFTIGNQIHKVTIQRSDKDVIAELRIKNGELRRTVNILEVENYQLRRLVYSTKPKFYDSFLYLLDMNTELVIKNAQLKGELKKCYKNLKHAELVGLLE